MNKSMRRSFVVSMRNPLLDWCVAKHDRKKLLAYIIGTLIVSIALISWIRASRCSLVIAATLGRMATRFDR
jgi:hypothetical protein